MRDQTDLYSRPRDALRALDPNLSRRALAQLARVLIERGEVREHVERTLVCADGSPFA